MSNPIPHSRQKAGIFNFVSTVRKAGGLPEGGPATSGSANTPGANSTSGPMPIPGPLTGQQIRLVPLSRMAIGGRWRVEAMRSYSSDLLLWFTRGQGRITISGTTRGYGPHNAIFIPAGTMHGFDISGTVFGTAVFLPVRPELTLPETTLHLRVREQAPQTELTAILENLQRELDSGQPDSQRAAFCHVGLLSVWLQRVERDGFADNPKTNKAAALTADYTKMVEEEFRSGRTVNDYARALGITPTHLSRVCRQTCGRPASEILAERIGFEARRLLRETKMPVNQVALQLGFSSPAYFSRTFRKHTGQTPLAFRKNG